MKFESICKMEQDKLKTALEKELESKGYTPVVKDGFIYAKGSIPVMLVAHMDTVHHDRCTIICTSENGDYLMSPQGIGGDDRCGIFMVLETIKTLNCHVLFTEDEEIGCIGAGKFTKSGIRPDINYMIEFDRKGSDDAVFYSCDNKEFEKFITDKTGFKTASGSCSDISTLMPYLDIAAVNLSCGYYDQHTRHEYVKVSEMLRNIERAKDIIRKPCEKFEYVEKKYSYDVKWWKNAYDTSGNKEFDYDFDYGYHCNYDYGDDLYESYITQMYDNIDETAVNLFSQAYNADINIGRFYNINKLEGDASEFLITDYLDPMGTYEYADENLCSVKDMYIDENSSVYVLTTDSEYGIPIMVETGCYIERKDGEPVMYYPDLGEEYYTMNESTYGDFVLYVCDEMEGDIDAQAEIYAEAELYKQ